MGINDLPLSQHENNDSLAVKQMRDVWPPNKVVGRGLHARSVAVVHSSCTTATTARALDRHNQHREAGCEGLSFAPLLRACMYVLVVMW
jgi:hypothetical protein